MVYFWSFYGVSQSLFRIQKWGLLPELVTLLLPSHLFLAPLGMLWRVNLNLKQLSQVITIIFQKKKKNVTKHDLVVHIHSFKVHKHTGHTYSLNVHSMIMLPTSRTCNLIVLSNIFWIYATTKFWEDAQHPNKILETFWSYT